MTLDEYEILFLKEREKNRKRKKVKGLMFVAGLLVGQVLGVMALALVSINRGEDGR